MHLDSKLTWKKHITNITEKARKRFSIMKRLARKKRGSSLEVLKSIYNIDIKPLMLYGAEALISADNTKLEIVQNKAM